MRPDTYARTPDGRIMVGGVSLSELAERFGTPLMVMDGQTLATRMGQYRKALGEWGHVHYAAKAFCCRAMLELATQEGLGVDVVSGGELFTALTAGIDPANILFHGNVKSPEEIKAGLDVGVGRFVVDSLDELEALEQEASRMRRTAAILLRVAPGIEAHTHEFVQTGHVESKFGLALQGGAAEAAAARAMASQHLRLDGFHAHIGSQILEVEPLVANANTLLEFSRRLWDQWGYWPEVLDIGGGLGVRYQSEDEPPSLEEIFSAVGRLRTEWTPSGMTPPAIICEPGRSIVAEAGCTIYRTMVVKETPKGRVYAAVDGGMGDNIRPALYGARYLAEVDNKPVESPQRSVTVVGRYCESGDILIENADLADPKPGDLLAVWGTGAYNYSMASNYNRVGRPAVVMVDRGDVQVWIEREDWRDLVRHDRPLRRRSSHG